MTGTSTAAGAARSAAPQEIYVVPARCTGCRSCEMACAVEHSQSKSLFGAITETPPPRRRIYVEAVDTVAVPVACRHCDEAFCMNACITGAIRRDARGFVVLDESRCIGCNSCIMLCPFGVIQKDEARHVAAKCDLCPDLPGPACVAACPTDALRFEAAGDFSRVRRRVAATVGAEAAGAAAGDCSGGGAAGAA
ncbi:MAG TPA: 4Fe-4S dicluster domain-containing protein [Thermoleophilia bacterium]|nr:4Fe-4S dicluster domain-containing protein [Thermoleophilia bacterium]